MPEFSYTDMLPTGADDTEYRLLTTDGISVHKALGREFLQVEPEVLTQLTAAAMRDIAHLLRPAHLKQLRFDPRRRGGVTGTTSSSLVTCSRTRVSPQAAFCPCARTRARRS